jgi:phenylpropionate dioxygenase-like ring-hydroxylating dioxygenase large terminal subunit
MSNGGRVESTLTAYPRSWYPLCRSADLRRGQVIRRQAFGQALAIFRTAQNQVAALPATCPHMGADLSRGTVIGERLRCPLHHWEYNRAGVCERIPGQVAIPAQACTPALLCEEHCGIVFAFFGGCPSFRFPAFAAQPTSGGQTTDPLGDLDYSTPSVTTVYSSAAVLAANSFDGQHFASVHGRQLIEPAATSSDTADHLAIRYRARVAGQQLNDHFLRLLGIDTVAIDIHCWGGNLLQVYNHRTPYVILVAILPIAEQQAQVFITIARPHAPGWLTTLARRVQLPIAHWLTIAFLKPDLAVLEGVRLQPGVLLPDRDACFLAWLRYWNSLPPIQPSGYSGAIIDPSLTHHGATVVESPVETTPESIGLRV